MVAGWVFHLAPNSAPCKDRNGWKQLLMTAMMSLSLTIGSLSHMRFWHSFASKKKQNNAMTPKRSNAIHHKCNHCEPEQSEHVNFLMLSHCLASFWRQRKSKVSSDLVASCRPLTFTQHLCCSFQSLQLKLSLTASHDSFISSKDKKSQQQSSRKERKPHMYIIVTSFHNKAYFEPQLQNSTWFPGTNICKAKAKKLEK